MAAKTTEQMPPEKREEAGTTVQMVEMEPRKQAEKPRFGSSLRCSDDREVRPVPGVPEEGEPSHAHAPGHHLHQHLQQEDGREGQPAKVKKGFRLLSLLPIWWAGAPNSQLKWRKSGDWSRILMSPCWSSWIQSLEQRLQTFGAKLSLFKTHFSKYAPCDETVFSTGGWLKGQRSSSLFLSCSGMAAMWTLTQHSLSWEDVGHRGQKVRCA